MSHWLNFAFDVGALAAALIAAFEGARRIAYDGVTRKRVLVVAAGLIWCAILSALQFYVSTVDSLKLNLTHATELAADWGKDLPPTQREESSRTRASVAYTSTGTLVDYVEASGVRKKYAPTQAELREREKVVALNQQLDTLSQNAYASGFRLILFPLFALLFGWGVGKEQRHVAANQSLQDGR
jgi:hypothetical protein